MDSAPVGLVVGDLADWPDGDLVRAHRLISVTVASRLRAGSFGSCSDDDDLALEAEQLGLELIARRLI